MRSMPLHDIEWALLSEYSSGVMHVIASDTCLPLVDAAVPCGLRGLVACC
jgi:hypothetical protein